MISTPQKTKFAELLVVTWYEGVGGFDLDNSRKLTGISREMVKKNDLFDNTKAELG